MFPFDLKEYQVPPGTALSIGASSSTPVPVQLNKDSLTDEISVVIEGVIGTAATTPNIDGLAAIVQQLFLRETNSVDGVSTVRYNNVPGARVRELYQAKGGQLPRVVGALSSTGAFRVEIPMLLRQLFLSDEFSFISAQKSWQMSDITLQVNPASIAQLDLAATPALVFSSIYMYVQQRTFERRTVPDAIVTLPTLTEYKEYPLSATGQLQMEIAGGGFYSLIGLTAFSGANTKQADGGSSPFTTSATAKITLQDMFRNNKIQTTYGDLRDDNFRKFYDSLVNGNAWFLFNRGVNQYMDARNIMTASQTVPIIADVTTGTGVKIGITTERIIGFEYVQSEILKRSRG